MKQVELDAEINEWFTAANSIKEAESNLRSKEVFFSNKTIRIAKMLLPKDAQEGESFIYPATNGKAIRVYLKPSIVSTEGGGDSKILEATIEPYEFN